MSQTRGPAEPWGTRLAVVSPTPEATRQLGYLPHISCCSSSHTFLNPRESLAVLDMSTSSAVTSKIQVHDAHTEQRLSSCPQGPGWLHGCSRQPSWCGDLGPGPSVLPISTEPMKGGGKAGSDLQVRRRPWLHFCSHSIGHTYVPRKTRMSHCVPRKKAKRRPMGWNEQHAASSHSTHQGSCRRARCLGRLVFGVACSLLGAKSRTS